MKVFIQKIKGRDRVRIKHGNQIFTIDDYNGYHGYEVEWLKNCVERFFAAYDKYVRKQNVCDTCGFFDGSGWCMKHKVSVGVKQTCPDYYESTKQPEAIDGDRDNEKIIEEILSEFECEACSFIRKRPGNELTLIIHTGQARKAMQIFASQQTASKDRQISDLSGELHATDKLNQELQDEVVELKQRISELEKLIQK